MTNDAPNRLDGLLVDWHWHALGYRYGADIGESAMFRDVGSGRSGAESEDDVNDATCHRQQMEAVNFHVFELKNVQWITALQMQARNLATGVSVWRSPRLPAEIEARAVLLRDARNALTARLIGAGVIKA